jgi:putative mRNA 3-end processing factor
MKGEVIVTTSGMLDGGPVLRYLMKEKDNRKSAVLIPGYQAEGSNGRMLLDKGKVAVETEEIGVKELVDVKCETQVFDLSAHADHNELLAFIRACDPDKVIFMHGDNRQLLADELKDEMKVLMPMTGQEYEI